MQQLVRLVPFSNLKLAENAIAWRDAQCMAHTLHKFGMGVTTEDNDVSDHIRMVKVETRRMTERSGVVRLPMTCLRRNQKRWLHGGQSRKSVVLKLSIL